MNRTISPPNMNYPTDVIDEPARVDKSWHGLPKDIWFGLSFIGLAAAVLSFASLRELAIACFIPITLAWLYPITLDVAAAVTCRIWLSKKANPEAERLARILTLGLLAITIISNGAHHGMLSLGIMPPWWSVVLLTSIPPAVVGAAVHLAVLSTRVSVDSDYIYNGEVLWDSFGNGYVSNNSTNLRQVAKK